MGHNGTPVWLRHQAALIARDRASLITSFQPPLILSGCQVCDWRIQCHLCSTFRGLWGLVVVWQSWLSGRALAAQARCPGFDTQWLPTFFTFLYFRLVTNFVYFQLEARCSILKCSLKSWSSEILRIPNYSDISSISSKISSIWHNHLR